MRPGEIVLENASRAFHVRADPGRTLKATLLGRKREEGPAPVQALRDDRHTEVTRRAQALAL